MSPDAARFETWAPPRVRHDAACAPRRLRLIDLARDSETAPDALPAPTEHAAVALRFDEEELARACAAAARQALDDSERRAAALAAEALAQLQQALAAALETLAAERDERLALAERSARALAMAVARRCLGRPRAELDEEIEALVLKALGEIDGPARLDVHLAPADVERLGARLPALAAAAGFAGELHCHADPALGAGSVRLGWGEAWAERDVGGWLRRLEERIEAHPGPAAVDGGDETTRESPA